MSPIPALHYIVCFAPHLPTWPRRTAGRTIRMRRQDGALLLLAVRPVPRVPRAQGQTRRKHGQASVQPRVVDEVRGSVKDETPGSACRERAHSMVPFPGALSRAVSTRTPGDESQQQSSSSLCVRRVRQHPIHPGRGHGCRARTCEDRRPGNWGSSCRARTCEDGCEDGLPSQNM